MNIISSSLFSTTSYFPAKPLNTLTVSAALTSTSTTRAKDTLKHVLAVQTAGVDVAHLFPKVIRWMHTEDLELKKLVYYYIVANAHKAADQAVLVVNVFVKSATKDSNPVVRALSLRAMAQIASAKVLEHLHYPLATCLQDENPYVLKTAVLAVVRLHAFDPHRAKTAVERVRELAERSENPAVVANALHCLLAVSPPEAAVAVSVRTVENALAVIPDANEWSALAVLDFLAAVDSNSLAASEPLLQEVLNRALPRLNSANYAIVLAAVRLLAQLLAVLPSKKQPVVKESMYNALTSLVSGPKEVEWVALKALRELLFSRECGDLPAHQLAKRQFGLFDDSSSDDKETDSEEGRVTFRRSAQLQALENKLSLFFVSFEDPDFVKREKIRVLGALLSPANCKKVFAEFAGYLREHALLETVEAAVGFALKLVFAGHRGESLSAATGFVVSAFAHPSLFPGVAVRLVQLVAVPTVVSPVHALFVRFFETFAAVLDDETEWTDHAKIAILLLTRRFPEACLEAANTELFSFLESTQFAATQSGAVRLELLQTLAFLVCKFRTQEATVDQLRNVLAELHQGPLCPVVANQARLTEALLFDSTLPESSREAFCSSLVKNTETATQTAVKAFFDTAVLAGSDEQTAAAGMSAALQHKATARFVLADSLSQQPVVGEPSVSSDSMFVEQTQQDALLEGLDLSAKPTGSVAALLLDAGRLESKRGDSVAHVFFFRSASAARLGLFLEKDGNFAPGKKLHVKLDKNKFGLVLAVATVVLRKVTDGEAEELRNRLEFAPDRFVVADCELAVNLDAFAEKSLSFAIKLKQTVAVFTVFFEPSDLVVPAENTDNAGLVVEASELLPTVTQAEQFSNVFAEELLVDKDGEWFGNFVGKKFKVEFSQSAAGTKLVVKSAMDELSKLLLENYKRFVEKTAPKDVFDDMF